MLKSFLGKPVTLAGFVVWRFLLEAQMQGVGDMVAY